MVIYIAHRLLRVPDILFMVNVMKTRKNKPASAIGHPRNLILLALFAISNISSAGTTLVHSIDFSTQAEADAMAGEKRLYAQTRCQRYRRDF
ncbi:MAG: hypothetical protein H0A75_04060 [Candidatus Methanofishera endochildressiae]|uniref:Uncharacterized protein n=1 Tax=Candidatus Methanofishera endochildressiae TaxID=2738884 RepID=A0A7Z0SCT5_9GAMM|nr:hypothetical protein [Candidatus Methanofishera endochildressiae]